MSKRYFTFFLIFSCLIWAGIGSMMAQSPENEGKGLLERGDKSFESGQYTEAMLSYSQLYEQGEFTETMLYRMAFMHENLRQYPEAIYYLKKAAMEFGDKGNDPKIRQLMQRQGSTRFFSGDGWNAYLEFYRSWSWLIYGLFVLGLAGIAAHILLPGKKGLLIRQIGLGLCGFCFATASLIMLHRLTMVPQRAVLMQETSFYMRPAFSSQLKQGAFSPGETLDLVGKQDIWRQVSAGGKVYWVPYWTIKNL